MRRGPAKDVEGQTAADDDDSQEKSDKSESACFQVAVVAFLVVMVGAALYVSQSEPQSQQHAWLSTDGVLRKGAHDAAVAAAEEARRAAAADRDRERREEEARYLARPLQQVPGLPAGPEAAAAEPPSTKTRVACATTAGPVVVDVFPEWAPLGARRFLDMVEGGFFSSRVGLFRSVKGFLCQTGVAGDVAVSKAWRAKGRVQDDPQWLDLKQPRPMKRGYLAFAGSGPDSRTTEFFFTYRDTGLGRSPWEVPFGKLVGAASYAALDRFYSGYGDMAAFGGHAPESGKIRNRGAAYLDAEFPLLDFITRCDVLPPLDVE